MTTFKLDTSGVVLRPGNDHWRPGITWPDLSPFVQGYVAGVIEAINFDIVQIALSVGAQEEPQPYGFFDLASETLARIMEDCERFQKPPSDWVVFNTETGADFWRDRQARQLTLLSSKRFPPLTPYLADDGKVHLREA